MTERVTILVVEDDDHMYEGYEDCAGDLNGASLEINLVRKVSVGDALTALLSSGFDGAIVDLNLDVSNPLEASGNRVLLGILERHRFPVLVVSGNLQNLDQNLRAKESEFLRFFERETPNAEIFERLLSVFRTGITKILGGRGLIEAHLGEIFWTHLSNDLSNIPLADGKSEKVLLRYIASHMSEYLDIPDGDDDFYHEAEVYIKPPIRSSIASGDVVEHENEKYIVLSPACDVAVRGICDGVPKINAEKIILAPLVKVERASFVENGLIKDNASPKDSARSLEGIIKGQRERYGFLPEYGELAASVVDFRNIKSIAVDEYLTYRRLATVSGVFMRDIQSRFASYMGRQGQPDLDKDALLGKYKSYLAADAAK